MESTTSKLTILFRPLPLLSISLFDPCILLLRFFYLLTTWSADRLNPAVVISPAISSYTHFFFSRYLLVCLEFPSLTRWQGERWSLPPTTAELTYLFINTFLLLLYLSLTPMDFKKGAFQTAGCSGSSAY